MQIIVMHPRFASAKSITLRTRHVVALAVAALALLAGMAYGISVLTLRYAGDQLPFMQDMAASAARDHGARQDKYVKENLAVMAVKLGEMQAQLMRLDALGERVQGLAGVKPEEFNFRQPPGRGGIDPQAGNSHALGMSELQASLDALGHDLARRSDYLNVVETALMTDKIKSKLLPTILPVDVSYNASGFGWRLDPFTGRSAFHEGIDFASPNGTPIVAAAGGVVIAAEYHPQYGNMLQIDHGNDIVSRYAHASRLWVKTGDIVKRGQRIADIGSTGRSTGAHLHFEVHVKGVPQNPHKFLAAGMDQARRLAGSPKK